MNHYYETKLEQYELGLPDAYFYYIPDFTTDKYDKLVREIEFTQGTVKVYGKEYDEGRLTCLMSREEGKSYTYSGKTSYGEAMTKSVKKLRVFLKDELQLDFDTCLANWYRDGNDKIGKHSDKETDLIPNSPIASLSFGAVRKFNIYPKSAELREYILNNRDELDIFDEITDIGKCTLNLKSGSLLLMGRGCQKYYAHEVPVEKKVKEGRINLTFRQTKPSDSDREKG